MQITGRLLKVGEVQQVTDKFKKRELWVETETNTDYPQTLSVQVSQDKAEQFNRKEGEEVTLDINLRGRRWTNNDGKEMVFNSIEAWRWQLLNESTPENSTPKVNDKAGGLSVDPNTGEVIDDDLPF